MTQGRKRQAWTTMSKLVPSAYYIDTENDDKEDVEIKKVCFKNCQILKLFNFNVLNYTYLLYVKLSNYVIFVIKNTWFKL